MQGVVPVAVEGVPGDGQGGHRGVVDIDPCGVDAGVEGVASRCAMRRTDRRTVSAEPPEARKGIDALGTVCPTMINGRVASPSLDAVMWWAVVPIEICVECQLAIDVGLDCGSGQQSPDRGQSSASVRGQPTSHAGDRVAGAG